MKSTSVAFAAALAGQAAAFPKVVFEAIQANPELLTAAPVEKRVGFDAATQYVSNTGEHAFVAPSASDLRGPCPGLNAMANHGYIPHNGVATIQEFIDGTYATFGMGLDLAGFLAIYGAIFDGDLLSWSIGGPPPSNLLSPLAGLLGQPQGISGSHNKYESDVSPTRGDLYQYGNDYLVVLDQFKGLYNYQASETEETSNYDLDVLTAWRAVRFNQSLNENPYFFNGPFSGVLVQPAAYTFIYRFMGNKSAEYPEGRLSQDVLKSFFSITGDSPDNFKYTPGYEAIPDNWYKRAIGDEYTIPFFLTDVLAAAAAHPEFLSIGGNTGTVNSFTGVDITNLTGGVYDLSTLAEGNNLFCFVGQFIVQAGPDITEGLLQNTAAALSKLDGAVSNATAGLGCPKIYNIDDDQYNEAFAKYPGVTALNSDGTYGSTQSTVYSSSGSLLGSIL